MRQFKAVTMVLMGAISLVGGSRECDADHQWPLDKNWVVRRHAAKPFDIVHPTDFDRQAIALRIRVERVGNSAVYMATVVAYFDHDDAGGTDRYTDSVELPLAISNPSTDPLCPSEDPAGRRALCFRFNGDPVYNDPDKSRVVDGFSLLAIPVGDDSAILFTIKMKPSTDELNCEEPPTEDILEEETSTAEDPEYVEDPPE